MKNCKDRRATQDELWHYLQQYIPENIIYSIEIIIQYLHQHATEEAIEHLMQVDEHLGKVGLHTFRSSPGQLDRRPLGDYRPLFYVYLALKNQQPPRYIVFASCAYLENLLKRQPSWNRSPLGVLLYKLHKHIPEPWYHLGRWLTQCICNYAKHQFRFAPDAEPLPGEYFSLQEALGVYLLARRIGVEFETLFPPRDIK